MCSDHVCEKLEFLVGQMGHVGVNKKSMSRAGSKYWLGKLPMDVVICQYLSSSCWIILHTWPCDASISVVIMLIYRLS